MMVNQKLLTLRLLLGRLFFIVLLLKNFGINILLSEHDTYGMSQAISIFKKLVNKSLLVKMTNFME